MICVEWAFLIGIGALVVICYAMTFYRMGYWAGRESAQNEVLAMLHERTKP